MHIASREQPWNAGHQGAVGDDEAMSNFT
jgi:hypothetical protein